MEACRVVSLQKWKHGQTWISINDSVKLWPLCGVTALFLSIKRDQILVNPSEAGSGHCCVIGEGFRVGTSQAVLGVSVWRCD